MLVIAIWIGCGFIGYTIGNSKGRGGEGVAWGLLLGVIGIIVIACRRPTPQAQATRMRAVNQAYAAMTVPTPGAPAAPAASPAQQAAWPAPVK